MRRKLFAALAVIGLVAAAGCTIPGGGSTGTVDMYVSDQTGAIDDFRHVNVTFSMVGFQEADNGTVVAYRANKAVDLTRVKGDKAAYIGSFALPARNYSAVYLVVDHVDATLKNGNSVKVATPSNMMPIAQPVDVVSGETTTYVADFTIVKSPDGTYGLVPQASESGQNRPIDPIGNTTMTGDYT